MYIQERQTKTRYGADSRGTRAFNPRAYEIPENPARYYVAFYKKLIEIRPEVMLGPDSPFILTRTMESHGIKKKEWA